MRKVKSDARGSGMKGARVADNERRENERKKKR